MNIKSDFFESNIGNREFIIQENAELETKYMSRVTSALDKELEKRKRAELDAQKVLNALKGQATDAELKEATDKYTKAIQARADIEIAIEKEKNKNKDKVAKAAQLAEQNRVKKMNAAELRAYEKQVYEKLKLDEEYRNQSIKALKSELADKEKLLSSTTDDKERAKITSQMQGIQAQLNVHLSDNKKQQVAKERMSSFSTFEKLFDPDAIKEKSKLDKEAAQESYDAASKEYDLAKSNRDALEEQFLKTKDVQDITKKMQDAQKAGDKEALKALSDQLEAKHNAFKQTEEYQKAEDELKVASAKKTKAVYISVFSDLNKAWGTALEKTAKSLDSNLEAIYGSQGRMAGRLQGSDVDWEKSVVKIMSVVGSSGVVSQKELVKKMTTLVDSGVAYNLEMRAFIAETAENIASTFDATNSTLLRLIRIQQSDTTAARLGMEASLTKLFNNFFEDTSYLAQDVSDNVSASILDASAQLTKNQSLEFEYIVQKWLGSLYSVGLSAEAVNMIAQGLNALGTADYNALNDSGFATLFGMSASRSGGKTLTDIITGGLDADETNMLLRSMVDYLAEIAEGDDRLVKSTYAKMFNMSVTDLSTFSKLRETELESIYKSSVSYNTLMDEAAGQLRDSISRISMAQLVDTAIENSEVGAAALIGSNPLTYGTWKALSTLKDYVGKIEIPGFTALGTGTTSGIDLINVAQTGMVGMGLIGSLVAGVSSMLKGGATDLKNWDFSEFTDRAVDLKNYVEVGGYLSEYKPNKTSSGVSYSASLGVGNASGEDITTASLNTAQNSAKSSAVVGTEEQEEQLEMDKLIYESITDANTDGILRVASEIRDLLAYDRVFYTQLQTASVSAGFGAKIQASPVQNFSETVSQITQLAAQASAGVSATVTSEEPQETTPQTKVTSDETTYAGNSVNSSSPETATLDLIIQTAVEQALSTILSRYVTGIPVDVKNNMM